MRENKKYIAPVAEITEFECEDIITASSSVFLKKKIKDDAVNSFMNVGSQSWSDALKQ